MAYRFFLRNRNGPGQPSLDQLVFPGSVVDQMNRSFGDWHIAFACLLGKLLLSNQTGLSISSTVRGTADATETRFNGWNSYI